MVPSTLSTLEILICPPNEPSPNNGLPSIPTSFLGNVRLASPQLPCISSCFLIAEVRCAHQDWGPVPRLI